MLRLMGAAACLALAGCVTAGGQWARLDGRPADAQQLEVDATVCLGEAEKAKMAAPRQACGPLACLEQDARINQSAGAVIKACMAQKGYLLTPRP